MSHLPKELLKAYIATTYSVAELGLNIKIDEDDKALKGFLAQQNVKTWAFITAWNPESKLLSLEQNKIRNEKLRSVLKEYQVFDGNGIPENSDWDPEESIFIIGITKKDAVTLGRKFKQNAIVFGSISGHTELIICV